MLNHWWINFWITSHEQLWYSAFRSLDKKHRWLENFSYHPDFNLLTEGRCVITPYWVCIVSQYCILSVLFNFYDTNIWYQYFLKKIMSFYMVWFWMMFGKSLKKSMLPGIKIAILDIFQQQYVSIGIVQVSVSFWKYHCQNDIENKLKDAQHWAKRAITTAWDIVFVYESSQQPSSYCYIWSP